MGKIEIPKIEIHGHRGSRGTHPENTFPAFAEARDAGADFIELDVHLSADGQVVVFHDDSVGGRLCTDEAGRPLKTHTPLREITLEALRKLECGRLPQPRFPGQRLEAGLRIPTLLEVLTWMAAQASSPKLNLEIKRGPHVPWDEAERLTDLSLELLNRFGVIKGALVQSFEHRIVERARSREPGVRLSCLFEKSEDFPVRTLACGAQVAAIDYRLLTEADVLHCRERGVAVLPWTVNDPADWERLILWGVVGIITDYPRLLKQFLTRSSS